MRPQNSTLTARQVHRCAAAILQDHLKLPDHGPKCRAGLLLTLLFYAAARLTSLSDACQSLRDAPSDEAARYPFLMPVIRRGRDLDDPRGPSGTKVFLKWQSSGFGTYTLHDAHQRSAQVSICVKCRYYRGQWRRHGKQRLIYAFWGFQPPSFDWVRETYRQRFAIETTYRQLHQARIRTSTRDPVRRLLDVGIALILRNVWVWLHHEVLARPRRGSREIRLDLLRFRRMLLWLAHVVEQRLGVRDGAPTPAGLGRAPTTWQDPTRRIPQSWCTGCYACLGGKWQRRIKRMKLYPGTSPLLAFALLVLAPPLADIQAFARLPGEDPPREWLDRPGQSRVEGRLAEASSALRFLTRSGAAEQSLSLEPGSVVSFQSSAPVAAAIPPLFQVLVGETARLSGMLRGVTDKAVTLSVPWQAAEVQIARAGVQAVIQRPGQARLFADWFDRIDARRWAVEGKPELVAPSGRDPSAPQRGVRLPAGGAALQHRLAEPLVSGRIELGFCDLGQVASGQQWALELRFRGPAGPATVRVLLGWAEESLAVESPEGPALAVQRLARTAGWHRLTLRFSPDHTDIAVDGKELAHGKGPAGPLDSVRVQTRSTGSSALPTGLAGIVSEIQLVRFAEPPASLEIDPSQDEVRLVLGDQLYGTIRRADGEHIVIDVDDKPVSVDWSEVAGLFFHRTAAAAAPVEGPLARVEWRLAQGEPNQACELDHAEGAVTALSASAITLATPYAGTLTIPRDRLTSVRVLDRVWELVLDASAHHLGDNISTTPPLLDPPLPEGGVLERPFELGAESPRPKFVVLDVIQVVGETAGSPYSNLVLKGELRTYVALNGKRIDYINRYITTSNETPERIRIPIPQDLLKPGKNFLRIEQTGIASDPTWFDDLGILRIAVQALPHPIDRRPRP